MVSKTPLNGRLGRQSSVVIVDVGSEQRSPALCDLGQVIGSLSLDFPGLVFL